MIEGMVENTSGVRVVYDQLKVSSSPGDTAFHQSDTILANRVRQALNSQPATAGVAPNVLVNDDNGTITLAGTVISVATALACGHAAADVPVGAGPTDYSVQQQPAPGSCQYRSAATGQTLPDPACTPGAMDFRKWPPCQEAYFNGANHLGAIARPDAQRCLRIQTP